MNPQVDPYFIEGCGRCELVGTPQCKVNTYRTELLQLRSLINQTELKEELKWSQPCYTIDNKNVLILSAFKDYCFISFFKGALMKDPQKLLIQPTANMQAVRQLRFKSMDDVKRVEPYLTAYLKEAIEVERSGLKVVSKQVDDFEFPEELRNAFQDDPAFESAFYALTPGRQKGYLLHFAGAKQSKTRETRIARYKEKILEGLGFHDR